MKATKLASLGFLMPDDFPAKPYENVHSSLGKYMDTHKAQWTSFGSGWNGVRYRYRAMAEYDEQFTTSIKNHGNSPPYEERYKQDNSLFGFFVCAVSTIECFFYSTYWIGVILKPKEFPSDFKSLEGLYAKTIAHKFNANFQGDALTEQMTQCVKNTMYTAMKNMRDVLSHRGNLRRAFHQGGERNGIATMPINPKDSPDKWQDDFSIDTDTTTLYHRWLRDNLTGLITATDNFCKQKVK